MASPLVMIIQDVQVPQDYINVYSWDDLTKSRRVVYDDVDVRGRSEPHVFYSHTEAPVWEFSLHFMASVSQGDHGDPLGVMEKVSFIESLIMPDYGEIPGQGSIVRPAHLARIKVKRLIDAIGTIRDPKWPFKGAYNTTTGYPQQVDCTFSFHVQRTFGKTPYGYADIRRLTSRGQNRFNVG
jgi:hypothetical protein